jgi:hypothetical protein
LIEGLCNGILGKVIYFKNVEELKKQHHKIMELERGLFKRKAFEYEQEVRLISNNIKKEMSTHVVCKLNPFNFIENILIDPRASDWFVETIKAYCSKKGFKVTPIKSDLLT